MQNSTSARLAVIACIAMTIGTQIWFVAQPDRTNVNKSRDLPPDRRLPVAPVKATSELRQGDFQPQLEQVTLCIGDRTLQQSCSTRPWDRRFATGEIQIALRDDTVSAIRSDDPQQPLWTTKSVDKHPLVFLAANRDVGYFLRAADEGKNELQQPGQIHRIDLNSGKWMDSLQLDPDAGTKVNAVLAARADSGDLAILVSKKADTSHRVESYDVFCFRNNSLRPLWRRSFKAAPERGYGGVYVWGIKPPTYADSENQHLVWVNESLIVAAEAMQPLRTLSRESGRVLTEVENVWEFERGFLGPSVYSHYISRFGLDDLQLDRHRKQPEPESKASTDAREEFNRHFSCAVIGGPVVVPLNPELGSPDEYRIFVAVSKAPTRPWSAYLADCVIYELSENWEVISMTNLPQLVKGNQFAVTAGGLIWACQNDSFAKLLPSAQLPFIRMGGGGGDLTTRVEWIRQSNPPNAKAWLTATRASERVAFGKSFAFYLTQGGFISNKDDRVYNFPLGIVDLATGLAHDAIVCVPFEGTIPVPDGFERSDDRVASYAPHVIGITDLRVQGDSLCITLGTESSSSSLTFDLRSIALDSPRRQTAQTRDYTRKIASLDAPEALSRELQTAAGGDDVKYIQALLKAGADPNMRSAQGWTPLLTAASDGTAAAVEALIAAGSDVNTKDKNLGGRTVLMWAIQGERQSRHKVRSLLQAGADLELTSDKNSRTALMIATAEGDISVLEMLLVRGANAKATDKDGHGLLWFARKTGNDEIIDLLTQYGAHD